MTQLQGHSLAGMSTTRNRIDNDYYATPTETTLSLLSVENIKYPALEPACGEGHIAKLLTGDTVSTDLVYRGYGTGGIDFITMAEDKKYPTIITNPPFNLFQQFAEKSLKIATDKVILFGKLAALEGKKRGTFMQNSPLETVYVFKSRQNPLRNGNPLDENGKPWSNTMAFAWFVWKIGYCGPPVIKWL